MPDRAIGTSYPGKSTIVIYHGRKVTVDRLGNYCYGYLGNAFDFSLDTLYWGSEYAAGFPKEGIKYEQEIEDQIDIEWGYDSHG